MTDVEDFETTVETVQVASGLRLFVLSQGGLVSYLPPSKQEIAEIGFIRCEFAANRAEIARARRARVLGLQVPVPAAVYHPIAGVPVVTKKQAVKYAAEAVAAAEFGLHEINNLRPEVESGFHSPYCACLERYARRLSPVLCTGLRQLASCAECFSADCEMTVFSPTDRQVRYSGVAIPTSVVSDEFLSEDKSAIFCQTAKGRPFFFPRMINKRFSYVTKSGQLNGDWPKWLRKAGVAIPAQVVDLLSPENGKRYHASIKAGKKAIKAHAAQAKSLLSRKQEKESEACAEERAALARHFGVESQLERTKRKKTDTPA